VLQSVGRGLARFAYAMDATPSTLADVRNPIRLRSTPHWQ
jgi:hypothetical protein